MINPITAGDWPVRDVLEVDEEKGRIYFTASGREPGDPYQRRVYRVDIDGQNLTLLSPEAADHTVDGPPESLLARIFGMSRPAPLISPDGSVFIDSRPEEHTSELQSLMRSAYAVFCLKKKKLLHSTEA